MSYPGTPSLSKDVQDRILGTFQHSLDLLEQGKEQEAILGCEFVLRMDAAFQPAQTLIQRIKTGRRPVPVADLRPGGAPLGGSDDLDGLESLDDLEGLGDLESLDDLESFDDVETLRQASKFEAVVPPPPKPAPSPGAASAFGAMIQDLLSRRNFQQVLQIAESQKQAIGADPQLREWVELARTRLESQPYVDSFLAKARQARAAGQREELAKALDKVRSLDPEHPEIGQLAALDADTTGPVGEQVLSFDEIEEDPLLFADDEPDATLIEADTLSFDDELSAFSAAQGTPDPFASVAPPAPAAPAPVATQRAAAPIPPRPAPPAPAPRAAVPFGEGDRIEQLLAEGQEAYERGENQTAIDIWSRIFLIDLDNEDASRRIESARNRKAELERQAEEAFHEGVAHLESRSLAAAKESFEKVLSLQPNHSLAREYVHQLEQGKTPVLARPLADAGMPGLGLDSELAELAAVATAGKQGSRSLEAAVQRDRVVIVKKTDWRPIALGALVLVLVLGGIFYLASKWKDLFPNAESPGATVTRAPDFISSATEMHAQGKVENAVRLLEKIQEGDPNWAKAQALIAQWKAELRTAAEAAAAAPNAETIERHGLLVQAGREANGAGQALRTRRYLGMADKLIPLAPDDAALLAAAEQKLQPLQPEIDLYEQGEYAQVIPQLWRKRDENPQDADLKMLLVDSYYNLAVTDLQRNQPADAIKKLQDALEVDPQGRDLQRLLLFAQSYEKRSEDLLYRIYVKYLPERKL